VLKAGDIVDGRYKIVRPIAEGGMGSVFLAEHLLIGRKVAVKFLRADLVHDATALRRFMNEAWAAGTLGHPNIVASTDMGFCNDVPYIVYEYVEGRLLSEQIVHYGPLPVARALAVAWQIAAALGAAHDAGIVHRDLKSDNIFLVRRTDEQDHVKVLDFGISRFLTASDRTAAGSPLIGTPEFMAPEQILAPDRIDKRVDIYALGILLYEMLTRHVPFPLAREADGTPPPVETVHALLGRICEEPPPPIARTDLPPGLDDMIRGKLLAKQPRQRFSTMREVREAIELLGGVLPIGQRWTRHGADLRLDLENHAMTALASVVAAVAVIADGLGLAVHVDLRAPSLRITIPGGDRKLAEDIEAWLRANGW